MKLLAPLLLLTASLAFVPAPAAAHQCVAGDMDCFVECRFHEEDECEYDPPVEPCVPWETGVEVTVEEHEAEACVPYPSPVQFRACPQDMEGYVLVVAGKPTAVCFTIA